MPVGRSAWAIAAGYLGLLSLALFPAPLALVASIIVLIDIRSSRAIGQPKDGLGRAISGLIMGVLGTGLLLLPLFGLPETRV